MKHLLILLLAIDFVYSQFGFSDPFKVFQSPFFRGAAKLAANINLPNFSGLSSSDPSCSICSFPSSYYTKVAQEIANGNLFPNIPNSLGIPYIPPDFGSFSPPTPAPLERRPSIKYPEIKNSLNNANSRLKTIGGPKGGGLDLRYRVGK